MNMYIKGQIMNMTIIVKTFQNACKSAALQDDGTIDKHEQKQINEINAACEKFIKKLQKIK